ncbi:MAG: hypothetical protein NTZ78_07370 [Candidatus Aureabacteria bacterium]|nr:hypothetical protein [Candidatus Auribacterota bacterium]
MPAWFREEGRGRGEKGLCHPVTDRMRLIDARSTNGERRWTKA